MWERPEGLQVTEKEILFKGIPRRTSDGAGNERCGRGCVTSVTFLHRRLLFSSPPPPHDMCLLYQRSVNSPPWVGGVGSFLSLSLSLSPSIKRQMTLGEGGREQTVAEQEYLSGNSHPSFIIDHKEDLIGGSNSWVGVEGGPWKAALMMTSSESESQRLFFISDNRLLVSVGGGADGWGKKEQPRAEYSLPLLCFLSQRAL